MSQTSQFNGTRGKPGVLVEGIFEEVSILELLSGGVMGDSMALVGVTSEALQGAGLEA